MMCKGMTQMTKNQNNVLFCKKNWHAFSIYKTNISNVVAQHSRYSEETLNYLVNIRSKIARSISYNIKYREQ